MKRNLIKGFVLLSLTFANLAQADFIFRTNTDTGCTYLSGRWIGTGTATNWFLGECIYHGTGTISALDSTGHFTADVRADKESGSFLCPSHSKKQVTGICVNGSTTISTEYGNIAGNFSENSGDAKGTLAVGPGMSAEVDIQFSRVE